MTGVYKEYEVKNGIGAMTTDKIKAFYWVLTWKLLFSDGWGRN